MTVLIILAVTIIAEFSLYNLNKSTEGDYIFLSALVK